MCGRTGLKYTLALYLRSRFNSKVNPLKTADLGKTLHIFAASMEILQILPLFFKTSPFLFIIAIFLNKILLEIKIFTSIFKSFNSCGIVSKVVSL